MADTANQKGENEIEKLIQGTSEQAPKYKELIRKSQTELDAEQLDLFEEESKQNVDSDILATKKEINQVKRQLLEAKSVKPLVPKDVIKIDQKLIGLENGLAALERLKAELF